MIEAPSPEKAQQLLNRFGHWLETSIVNTDVLIQVGIMVALLFVTSVLTRIFRYRLTEFTQSIPQKRWYYDLLVMFDHILYPISASIILGLYISVAKVAEMPYNFVWAITNLLLAWIIISVGSHYIARGFIIRWLKAVVLVGVALNIFNVLDEVTLFLDSVGISIGKAEITIYTILKGVFIFIVLMWLSTSTSKLLERKIHKAKELTPSLKVLFSKILRIFLFALAIVIGLNTAGIDLTAFAVFSGAVGVGIGFGLQKVVSNLISGIILLSDRSIKPGDVIVVGDTYGWVNSLGARYVSVITRDGKEHLLPNELLITEKVENWSFSNDDIRIRIPVGVAYECDLHHAMALVIEAALEIERVKQSPEPRCLVRGFGDSSVDLELRVWIDDPANGMGNIQSDLLLKIWDKFQEHDIKIPYPQRDVHIIAPTD